MASGGSYVRLAIAQISATSVGTDTASTGSPVASMRSMGPGVVLTRCPGRMTTMGAPSEACTTADRHNETTLLLGCAPKMSAVRRANTRSAASATGTIHRPLIGRRSTRPMSTALSSAGLGHDAIATASSNPIQSSPPCLMTMWSILKDW